MGLVKFANDIISAATGMKLKVEAIKRHKELNDVRKSLLYCVSPYITFGVTPGKKQPEIPNIEPSPAKVAWLFEKLDDLAARKITGKEARELSKQLCTDPEIGWLAWRILKKDWRAGISTKLINKAIPGLIPEFNIALADNEVINPDDLDSIKRVVFPIIAEPKYDGVRCIVIVNEQGKARAFSREGIEYFNFPNILKEVESWGEKSFVLDGEVMGFDFNEVTTVHRRKAGKDDEGLTFMVFDFLSLSDFNAQRCDHSYLERRRLLGGDFFDLPIANIFVNQQSNGSRIMLTDAIPIDNPDQIIASHDKVKGAGLEGLVLKDPESLYPYKRSDSWLKVKTRITVDGEIVDTFEGKGKHEGKLGGLVIEYKGHRSKVGTGFSDADREVMWNNRDSLIGKIVEVSAQEVTKYGALRCPSLICVRDDKTILE